MNDNAVSTAVAQFTESVTNAFTEHTDAPDDVVEEIETAGEQLAEQVDDLESSHEITQQSLWSLEDCVMGDWGTSNPRFEERSLVEQIDDVEDTLEGANPGEGGGETTLHDTVGEDWTPIERSALMDHDELKDQSGPSDRRAIMLFKHWGKWSTSVQAGNILKTCDSLKSLLSTACEEDLSWKQVYRACRHVERLSKGAIVFVDHKKHGKMLKQTRDFVSMQATSGKLTSSSVA